MYSQILEKILHNAYTTDANINQAMSEYSLNFSSEGARKAKYIVDKINANPLLAGDQLSRFVAVSIGGADGSDLLEVATKTPIRRCILVEYDNYSAELARNNTRPMFERIQGHLDVIVGDANQQRELIVDKLREGKESGIIGLVLMFHGILHELPNRSPGFELSQYLARLTSVYPNNLLFISEPCSVSSPDNYEFRIIDIREDRLDELVSHINAHLFQGRYRSSMLSNGFVRAPLPLILETLHKLLRFNDVPRFRYEMGERLTQFTPEELRAAVNKVFPGARIKEERYISDGFDKALREADVYIRTLDNKDFHLEYSHVRFEVESLHASLASSKKEVENDVCPYRGLSAFDEDTKEFFFGKELEAQRIIEKLSLDNFVLVIGLSGSGKSSVVRAGVVHLLKPMLSSIHFFQPGTNPLAKLIACVEDIAKHEGLRRSEIILLCNNLKMKNTGPDLVNSLSTNSKHLIVIDQFEELFNLCTNEDEREIFLAHLIDIANSNDNRLAIVTTLKTDCVQSFCTNRDFAELVQHQAVWMLPMKLSELQRAIVEPAKLKGYCFQDGLVNLILDELGNENTSLPLLQFTLTELWKKRNTQTKEMTLGDYYSIGRVSGCLNMYAENIYMKLSDAEKEIMKRMFLRLVRPSDDTRDSKQRRPKRSFLDLPLLSETTSTDVVEDLLQDLISSRLLMLDLERGEEMIDMVHEALMDGWQRLADWRQEDRSLWRLIGKIDIMHNEWVTKGKQDDFLIHGGQLKEIISNMNYLQPLLDSETREFCDISLKLYRSDQNRTYMSLSLDMALLVENAKLRLSLADPKDYRNEAFIELYSKRAELKNIDFDSGKILEVYRADLVCSDPFLASRSIWSCSLSVRHKEIILPWGMAFVNIHTRRSELLLDNRPQAWTGCPFISDGYTISKLRLMDGSFTKEAITLMEARFSEYYNGLHKVSSFGGFLKDGNRRQFQKEFAILKEESPSLSNAQLYQKAIIKTSFGKARLDLAIVNFDILVIGDDSEISIEGIGPRHVPDTIIVVDAWRESK